MAMEGFLGLLVPVAADLPDRVRDDDDGQLQGRQRIGMPRSRQASAPPPGWRSNSSPLPSAAAWQAPCLHFWTWVNLCRRYATGLGFVKIADLLRGVFGASTHYVEEQSCSHRVSLRGDRLLQGSHTRFQGLDLSAEFRHRITACLGALRPTGSRPVTPRRTNHLIQRRSWERAETRR